MILFVDIGNSRVKWCLWHNRGGCFPSQHHAYVSPLHASYWDECFGQVTQVDRMVVASVASQQVNQSLGEWFLARFNHEAEFVSSQTYAAGVHNAYEQPHRLGIDRWAAMVGGYHLEAGAVCVVDCGTAVTVDVVDPQGRHQGGAIIPGKGMMLMALNRQTARIDASIVTPNEKSLGQDTDSCVAAGIKHATIGMIERIVTQYSDCCEGRISCLITGGDAQEYIYSLSVPCRHEPDLVLTGLAILAGVKV